MTTQTAHQINDLQNKTLAALRQYPEDARLYVQLIDNIDNIDDAYPDGCEPCFDAETVGDLLTNYCASASQIGDVDTLRIVGASLEYLYTGARHEIAVVLYGIA